MSRYFSNEVPLGCLPGEASSHCMRSGGSAGASSYFLVLLTSGTALGMSFPWKELFPTLLPRFFAKDGLKPLARMGWI